LFPLQVTNGTRVCSAHFKDDDYKKLYGPARNLKPTAVPSVFQWTTEKPKRKPPTQRRTNIPAAAGSASALIATTSASGDTVSIDVEPADDSQDVSVTSPTNYLGDHDYADKPLTIEEQLDAARHYISDLENKLANRQPERFGLERFSCDDQKIRFYTGFPSYELLTKFYTCIVPHIQAMQTWSKQQRRKEGELRERCQSRFSYCKLSPIDQLFMFLHKLRLGSFDQELADKFLVSQATVSRNTITWVNFLYAILGSQPLWPSREQCKRFMPSIFVKHYPNTRVIIDCTEIYVQSPSSLVLNSELFSSYKGRNTLKCLVGVTPAGAVSFISALHAGSISDKQITKVSGFLDLLETDDVVMADKGFVIDDLLAEKNCKLVIPNFLQQKGQFSAAEAEENKTISNLRVHVERANRRFKEFHLFDSPVPLNLVGSINQLWTVACLLTNFQGPLIVNSICNC
jgi:hypothetical protein